MTTATDRAIAKVDQQAPRTEFQCVGEGRYRLDAGFTVLEADYLRRENHQLKAEVLVRCELPGARTHDGILSVGDLNLSSTRSRSMHANYLAERSQAGSVDWTGLLEEFAQRILAAQRDGDPAVYLHELPRPEPAKALEVDGLPLLDRHPLILFGDGGTAKSCLSLYVAGMLAERGLKVGYFDWELDGSEHRDRLERLFGSNMPPIRYARCSRPLVFEADRLRRIVRDDEIDYIVIDSVAFACDGPPEAAEVAGRYFQALRQLGTVGSLHVAHVTKSFDTADRKPFGSVFWHNGARSTWNVKQAEGIPGDAEINIALHHRKANLGAKRASIGFQIVFSRNDTEVRRVEVADIPDLAVDLSVRQRMAVALSRGPLSPDALAHEILAKPETIKREARRHKRDFTLIEGGKIALLETRR